ncbi:MAG: hypothetical protein IJC54_00715 [Clostridia bacterium]|nr:hypothetical protein [Clostridia bacterium]MBQ4085076.1 hypothetical protein [Clostridia bacterium]
MMTEVLPRGRHSGWSAAEDKLLWETADEAQQQGLPLKAVFERIAQMTGRRPNSIRNYYYAQVRQKEGDEVHKPRFVPFREDEVEQLLETVLRDKAQGASVRACLTRLAGGDRSLMLRYQNKYRAVIKNKPETVEKIVEKLRAEGVICETPQVHPRTTLADSCARFASAARRSGDAELIRACDILAEHLLREGETAAQTDTPNRGDKVRYDLCRMALQDAKRQNSAVCESARPVIDCIKEQLALSAAEQAPAAFLQELAEKLGPLEEAVTQAGC